MALCIEASLRGLVIAATLVPTSEGEEPSGGGVATLSCTPVVASIDSGNRVAGSLNGDVCVAALSPNNINAWFSVSCPIEYITSCFSLGGWDDNLGWDDEQGWMD